MSRLALLGKVLEGLGLILVLVGVLLSMRLGLEDESLASMEFELKGLLAGGALFVLGWALERAGRSR
jgi:hypothetical protein